MPLISALNGHFGMERSPDPLDQFRPFWVHFGLFLEVRAWILAIFGKFRGSGHGFGPGAGHGFGPFLTYFRGSWPISRPIWTILGYIGKSGHGFGPFLANFRVLGMDLGLFGSVHGFGPFLSNFGVLGMYLSHSGPIQWV